MDFVCGFLKDSGGNTGIVVSVDCYRKKDHLAVVTDSLDNEGTSQLFIDRVFSVMACLWQLCK